LYANFEPSPNDLKRYAKYDDSQLIIQDGVHIVLKSLKYKLISDSLYQLLTKREKWIDIKNRFNLV
jgi:sulfur transfer complex TusBCD TusB component (DsrH family)